MAPIQAPCPNAPDAMPLLCQFTTPGIYCPAGYYCPDYSESQLTNSTQSMLTANQCTFGVTLSDQAIVVCPW